MREKRHALLASLPQGDLVRLAMAVEDPAQQVLTIKAMLPSCDVANLILERPSILSLSKEVLAHRIEAGV